MDNFDFLKKMNKKNNQNKSENNYEKELNETNYQKTKIDKKESLRSKNMTEKIVIEKNTEMLIEEIEDKNGCLPDILVLILIVTYAFHIIVLFIAWLNNFFNSTSIHPDNIMQQIYQAILGLTSSVLFIGLSIIIIVGLSALVMIHNSCGKKFKLVLKKEEPHEENVEEIEDNKK